MQYKVDKEGTKTYLDMFNKPCNCIYCKNYQMAFPNSYPEIVKLLQEFGVLIDHPLEIMDFFWNPEKNKRLYISYYSVKGELFSDKLNVYSNGAVVTLYQSDTDEHIYNNTGMEKPYFIVEISNIQLPWVLDEVPDD
jgi:hypothetical protein